MYSAGRPSRWALAHILVLHLLLGGVAVLCTQMQSIHTDRVAWSVGLSVTPVSPAKMTELIEMPFALRTWVAQGTMYWMDVQIPPYSTWQF